MRLAALTCAFALLAAPRGKLQQKRDILYNNAARFLRLNGAK